MSSKKPSATESSMKRSLTQGQIGNKKRKVESDGDDSDGSERPTKVAKKSPATAASDKPNAGKSAALSVKAVPKSKPESKSNLGKAERERDQVLKNKAAFEKYIAQAGRESAHYGQWLLFEDEEIKVAALTKAGAVADSTKPGFVGLFLDGYNPDTPKRRTGLMRKKDETDNSVSESDGEEEEEEKKPKSKDEAIASALDKGSMSLAQIDALLNHNADDESDESEAESDNKGKKTGKKAKSEPKAEKKAKNSLGIPLVKGETLPEDAETDFVEQDWPAAAKGATKEQAAAVLKHYLGLVEARLEDETGLFECITEMGDPVSSLRSCAKAMCGGD